MITPLGALLFVAVVVALVTPVGLTRVLAASAGLPVGVSIIAAGNSLTVFYTLGLAVMAAQAFSLLNLRHGLADGVRRTFPGRVFADRPGSRALLVFVGYSLLVTLVAPTVFRGIPVLVARNGLDSQLIHPGRLDYSVSNVAQGLYVLVGACVIVFVAQSRKTTSALAGLPLVTLTLLSFWRLLHRELGVPFLEMFFDNSPNVRYIESSPGGEPRFRGIYSEPSGLAEGSLATLAFFVTRLPYLSGRQRVAAVVIIAIAAYNGSVSTSATFVLASLILVTLIVVVSLGSFILRNVSAGRFAVVGMCVLFCAVAIAAPAIVKLVQDVVAEKVASDSYASRSGVDIFSFSLILQTWGAGVGLGSNRPSSMVLSVFSCAGVIGGVAYYVFMAVVIRRAWPLRAYRSVIWAYAAELITKTIAGPAMLDPIPVVLLGVLSAAAWRRRDVDPANVPLDAELPGLRVLPGQRSFA